MADVTAADKAAEKAAEKDAKAAEKDTKLKAAAPPEVTPFTVTPIEKPFVTAQYYGDSGGSTQYWYWVQAVYAMGFGPLSTNTATVTVLSLSHSNVVSINWTPCTSAMYYNVWRTTTSAAPTAGTGQCIANGLATADGLVDNGIAAFTIAVGTPPALLSAEEQKKQQAEVDKLIEEMEKKLEKDEEQAVADAQKAKKLDDLYRERFQLPVRLTDAQKTEEARKRQAEETATQHKADAGQRVTRFQPGETEPPASPEKHHEKK